MKYIYPLLVAYNVYSIYYTVCRSTVS